MMSEAISMKIIARIRSEFPTKFGIPRQSGVVEELRGTIVFEPEYRNADALRGLEGFSHIWLLWQFNQAVREDWSPTVRPPRLGGNTRVGVFATRSPFRPNAIGLSSVRLLAVERHPQWGTVLQVAGGDLVDGTPIFDIKPYLLYGDCHPDATVGFAPDAGPLLAVDCPAALLQVLPEERQGALLGILAHDPRPSYHSDPHRLYGFSFAGYDVKFTVADGVVTVQEVRRL